ncbi:flap endonuclease GEN homolog 1-like isoform X2 [Liolophura sinensis]|uniref:flap endonuclease GEN homolog 1-like isoform X2 n=1 Tax=Liolophura sinensis TaxID=3198878 RepID=UPI0031591401
MGVIQLWSVLAPVKKHVPLSDLKGQTLAVDLSIWVCESNAVRQMQGVVLKPHLRNLFFRVSNLTQMGIKLIFAIDGEAPDLKRDTMAKRQQARHQGKHKTTSSLSKPKRKGRSQFNTILKECCELLSHLGIPYIYSQGEAEALCALLNRQGIADGCLTEDGDAFLYGARTVYRNFTLNTKDPHVESYCGEDIEKSLGLGQEGLVGLALLLGCDYLPKGVPGVGKEQVLKLVKLLEGVNILDRFEAWQTEDGSNLEGIEKAVWKKAMKVENFPNHEVINEFLVAKDTCAAKEFRQRRPWIEKLQDFLFQKLDWPREYTEEKVLPLITLWDMTDILLTGQHKPALHLVPHRIVKRRVDRECRVWR